MHEKWWNPALAFVSKRGSQTPAEKRERISRKGGKREKKKTNQNKTSQTLGREGGMSKRGAREKICSEVWCKRDGASQNKGKGKGWWGDIQ